MGNLNAFRLSYETAFLFVLSYEYNIPFPKLLGMYDISDKVFWAYMSLFTNMSKMGVRKGNQLSKIANRIYKNIRGIKDKTFVRTEVDVTDEDGNLVYDDKGNILKEKQTKVETSPVTLNEDENKIKDVMHYYITHGYTNGENFYTDNDIMDMRLGLTRRGDTISIDGDLYSGCTKIEYMIERYFPEMTASEFRNLSVKEIGTMLNKVEEMECKLDEARA